MTRDYSKHKEEHNYLKGCKWKKKKKHSWKEWGKQIQTTNYVFRACENSCHNSASCLWVSVYWCAYSVITTEMRLCDGNWCQPVVIFRWLMMRAIVRRNRSKQLIYTAQHNSPSSISQLRLEKCFFAACVCWFRVSTQKGRGVTEAFVLNIIWISHKYIPVLQTYAQISNKWGIQAKRNLY